MSYDLIENELQYLSELKETTMIKHVGSGPKDPAPEEKDARDPEEDAKGVGTQQAGTKDPGKIPGHEKLGKELAKEGMSLADELEWALEMCGKDHSKDKKSMKEQDEMEAPEGAEKEMKDEEKADEAEAEMAAEQAKPDFLDVDKDKDKEEPMKKAIEDKEEKEEGEEDKEEMAEEQLTLKQQNRMYGSKEKQYVPGSPAEKEARMAANTPPASIQPAAVQKMRRPVQPRPVNLSDRMKGKQFQTRPVRMGRL